MTIPRGTRRLVTRRTAVVALLGAAVLAVLVPVGSARQQAAPTNTVQPTITGTPSLGQTLTAAPGTWTGDPTFGVENVPESRKSYKVSLA